MKRRILQDGIEYIQFVLPIFALFALFFLVPFVQGLFYSFTDWNSLSKYPQFTGVRNYIAAVGDHDFLHSISFTLYYTLIYLVAVNVIAMLLALLMTRPMATAGALRATLFSPYILNVVTIGFVWQFIFGRFFTSMFQHSGFFLFGISWLGDDRLVAYTVAIVKTWQSVGYFMILYIAGLQMIPTELYEVATIDGAGAWRLFWKLTLPLLMPSVTVAVFLALVGGMTVFPLILTLTGGGPGKSSTSIAMYIYAVAFEQQRFGYGSALAVLFVVMMLVISLLQLKVFRSREASE